MPSTNHQPYAVECVIYGHALLERLLSIAAAIDRLAHENLRYRG
jgi:hypothetical protein